MPSSSSPNFTLNASTQALVCSGNWTVSQHLESLLKQFDTLTETSIKTIDANNIDHLDSVGAWMLWQLTQRLKLKSTQLVGLSEEQQALFAFIQNEAEKIAPPKIEPKDNWLIALGKNIVGRYQLALSMLTFLGELCVNAAYIVRHIGKLQWRSFLNTIDETGYQALPIIGLLSALIGVVLAYQMGQQLKVYGANIYIVGLLGVGVLQEFGPLIAAIIVVGRTSSAFTAQLGLMKVNQEIDALRTMGLSPMDRLVIPKILGLLISLPLLILWADIFGIIGGMFVSKHMLGISFYNFLQRFPDTIQLSTLFNGLIKAPVFAVIIGGVGCFQGLTVSGGADNVGRQTTRSVVQAIFLIIIADAIFSIILPWQSLS